MWFLSWRKYSLSKFATFISIIGALIRYGGFLCLFAGLVPGALVCIPLGILFHLWAENISFKKWKKEVIKNKFDEKVRAGDSQTAIKLYNSNPCKKTLKYFDDLNPQIAKQIREMLAQKK